jgi:hypothetical protein
MLESLLSRWRSKLFVLALLGFVATDFVITITLSAADASEHIIHNPFVEEHLHFLDHPIPVTLFLIFILAAVFLKGFKEAIGIAVFLVISYLLLNLIVISNRTELFCKCSVLKFNFVFVANLIQYLLDRFY